MRKKQAEKFFKQIYDATFDDAVTYIYGKTGDLDIVNTVLFYTYNELYLFLKKQRIYIDEITSDFFYECLNDMIAEFCEEKTPEFREINPSDQQHLDKLLDVEFDLNDEVVNERMIVKKVHSYLMQKNVLERKIFLLYFFKGFDVRRISGLLGVNPDKVYGCLCTLLKEIKSNFLANYLTK